ncbi:hypothetical protein IAD21_00625 [Abditibacteriota bacterium]|nr:hypothetical protein IAD21_00625 [Abditibacteriota bacterium]
MASDGDATAPFDTASRHAAIEKLLVLFCAAYDREPPDALERKLKVGVWVTALIDVPVAEILPLAKRELAERESAFFPVPADLLRRWNTHQKRPLTPEGAANATAYLPYVPSTRFALSASLSPLQIELQELKRRLGYQSKPSRSAAPPPKDDASALPDGAPLWSALLLDVARAGNIALELCSPAQIADLRAFGRWSISHYPTRELTPSNFAVVYGEFVTARTDDFLTTDGRR